MAKKEASKNVDAENTEGGEGEAPKKGGKLKLIVIVLLAMILGGGGAVAVMKFVLAPSAPVEAGPAEEAPPAAEAAPPAKAEGEAPKGEGEAAAEPAGPQIVEFKPFVVNLNDAGGKRFLKLTMSMEAETPALAEELNVKMAQIRDVLLLLLSSLSYDDISNLDGKMRLRSQMLNRTNTLLTSGKIKNIFFSEFVVQ